VTKILKYYFPGLLWLALAVSFFPETRVQAQANGIYADFTTSMGSFTCKLEYAISPKAVANFVGLATGQQAWLDYKSGVVRTNPFYDGLIFHRVISNFMVQAGSPNGVGTDGPGYVFPDEISPSLRFTNTGVLAMANTGTNSNGAQFFITATNYPSLNDGYTIFGELAGGTNVVLAIDHVATDVNDKPLTNVTIQKVNIRRVGAAALAFNAAAQGLPAMTNITLKITNSPTQVSLSFSNRLYTDNFLFYSSNLTQWNNEDLGCEIGPAFTNTFWRAKDTPSKFYRGAQSQYPGTTFAPRNVLGKTATIALDAGYGSLVLNFTGAATGTYVYNNGTPGTITYYAYFQQPYRGYIPEIDYSALNPMTLKLNYVSATNGTLAGTVYTGPGSSFSITGHFTIN
jgi:cyclophilin family peptidyl-prolyl cis-trans isomerase